MHQVVSIHGGMTFPDNDLFYKWLRSYELNPRDDVKKWKNWLKEQLPESCEFFSPSMPNNYRADYEAWKIWFEHYIPFLDGEKLVLIGHSLGAVFLCKYLIENELPKQVDQLHLIGGAVEDNLPDDNEYIGNFAFDKSQLSSVKAENIFVYHSKDDEICPFEHGVALHEGLGGTFVTFEDRGHFLDPEFPELLANITESL